ncbi:MAG: tetratricopeptide repeat protein [Porphyromonas sp.]|nr:tetratricopeptide repeat protein [Porphyromonas sp.]
MSQSVSQSASPDFDAVLRSLEAFQLGSPIGTLESLRRMPVETFVIGGDDAEARYLDAVSRGLLQTADAELQLLRFIETHPHSSYLPYAQAQLGLLYYAKSQYQSTLYWLGRIDTKLFPDDKSAVVEYAHAYALMSEGQLEPALQLLEPLIYYPTYRSDALFYAGYICLRQGRLEKGTRYLEQVATHPLYGSYANAYIAEVRLSEMQYSEALDRAVAVIESNSVPDAVAVSLYRTAALAANSLGQQQNSVDYFTRYFALEKEPGRVEQLVMGKNLFELRRYAEAERYLLSAAEEGNDFMSQLGLYYAGLAQLSLQQPSRAMVSFDRSAQINAYAAVTEASMFNAALTGYAQTPGRLSDGSRRLVQFLQTYPQSEYRVQVIGYLSDAFLNEPNATAALSEINGISPLPRELAQVRDRVKLRRANSSLTEGDTQSATRQYDDIIRSNGDPVSVAEAYLWKGEAAYRSKDYREAIRSTELYLQNRPIDLSLNPNAYYTLGYAHYNLGEYDVAERYFKDYERVVGTPTPDQKSAINNRLGDIEMQRRAYESALGYYAKAEQAGGAEADYALYYRGMIKGLQRMYKEKADLLGTLEHRFPDSKLIPQAIYEQGKALQLAGDSRGAQQLLTTFMSKYRHHELASKVGLQLALSYYGDHQLDQAVDAYESVVRQYPNTPEAKSALQDLKSISVQMNRVDSYSRLVDEVGANDVASRQEMDSLAYLAAERVVGSGTPMEAQEALDKYLSDYPDGAFVDHVYYNKALLQYNAKDYRGAVSIVASKAKSFTGKLADDTYRLLASSYDRLGEPGRAAEAYMSLALGSTDRAQRSNWVRAAAERAEESGSSEFLVGLAEQVSTGVLSVDDEARGAVYLAAAKDQAINNHKSKAIAYAKKVVATKGYEGNAIAETILALDLYDRGDYQGAQSKMERVTQVGTTDAYWLARAFILLSDTYVKLGDKETAKAYLESVKGSYPNRNDGIMQMINNRLANL